MRGRINPNAERVDKCERNKDRPLCKRCMGSAKNFVKSVARVALVRSKSRFTSEPTEQGQTRLVMESPEQTMEWVILGSAGKTTQEQ